MWRILMDFKVGDRVKTEFGEGTVKSFPNDQIGWIHHDKDTDGAERGIPISKLERVALLKESVKKDQGKYDPTMLTIEMVELVSRVREFGAKKYARNNFKITGFKYTRSLAAALRHIFAYLGGENNDPESGLSHLGHAICCLEHCIYDSKHHPENDDRNS